VRIAQLSYLYYPSIGGVETVLKNISERLVSKGHAVDVFCSDYMDLISERRHEYKKETINGVNVYRRPSYRRALLNRWHAQAIGFSLKEQRDMLREEDVIHIHSFPSSYFFEVLRKMKLSSQKVFLSGHYSPHHLVMYRSSLRSTYWQRRVIPLFEKVDRYVAVAKKEAEALKKVWGITGEKIVVIPNGVNMKEMQHVSLSREQVCAKYNIEHEFLVLTVARITYSKGIDVLLKAARMLNNETDRKITYVVAGLIESVDYYKELMTFVEENGIKNVVFLQPDRQEIINLFNACDLFVLPSRGEVFGIVLIEAMACGKACIATRAGGIPEILVENRNGLLFDLDDYSDLAKKILFLKENAELRKMIGERNRDEVASKYDWDSIVDLLVGIYDGA